MNSLVLAGVFAFLASCGATRLVIPVAKRFGFIDHPNEPRKIHRFSTPLLGGAGLYVGILLVVSFLLVADHVLTNGLISQKHYVGFFLGGLILLIGGALDDRFRLPAYLSLWFPVLAAATAIGFGVEVTKLTNPLGGIILLQPWQSDLLVFVWLLTVIYTTKLLDGIDGLATTIVAIGTTMILFLSLSVAYFQPDVALLSAVSLGGLLGFLVWNAPVAKIFLGEGGSTFVGYLLGILAVISGGKLATATLVLWIPLLDVIWIIARRFRNGGLKAVTYGDRKHLHHRLFDLGWSPRLIVVVYGSIATLFGVLALFLQSQQKFFALFFLACLMIVCVIVLSRLESHASNNQQL